MDRYSENPMIAESAFYILDDVLQYRHDRDELIRDRWSDTFLEDRISLPEIALLLGHLCVAMDYLINIFDKDWLGVEPSASETQKIAISETETTTKEDK